MKSTRLRDGDATDPIWSELQRLCQAQPPTRVEAAMQARVLARIGDEAVGTTRQGRWRMAFVVVCVLLLAAATASATWGPLRRVLLPTRAPHPKAPSPPMAAPAPVAAAREPVLERESMTRPAPSAALATNRPSSRRTGATTNAAARSIPAGPALVRTTVPAATAPPHLEPIESAIVQAAVRALRVDHRPGRARDLLSDYLRRFPHGALAEDATALQIEAAVAAGDLTAARRWADRYQSEFPSGRFNATAASVRPVDSSPDFSPSLSKDGRPTRP
jgi:hypothetical protein